MIDCFGSGQGADAGSCVALPVWIVLILCLVYPVTASAAGLVRHYQGKGACLSHRHFRAGLRTSLAVGCAIMALATATAWIDSYVSHTSPRSGARQLVDAWSWQLPGGYLDTDEGTLAIGLFFPVDPPSEQWIEWTSYEFAGVSLDVQPMGDREHIYVCAPLWMFLVLFVAYPSIVFIRGPLRRRRKRGLCLTCGYNLTGNASGVCPECGRQLDA